MSKKLEVVPFLLVASALLALAGCPDSSRVADHEHDVKAHTHEELASHTHDPHAAIGSEEGCYTITEIESGAPHASVTDQFCVEERVGAMFLIPSIGMSDWTPSPIPLTREGASSNFTFNVDISGHPAGSDHGNAHNGVYRLQIVTSAGPTKATIRGAGRPVASGPVHGGVAHALQ